MEYLGWKGLSKDEESKDVEKKESRRVRTTAHLKNPIVSLLLCKLIKNTANKKKYTQKYHE